MAVPFGQRPVSSASTAACAVSPPAAGWGRGRVRRGPQRGAGTWQVALHAGAQLAAAGCMQGRRTLPKGVHKCLPASQGVAAQLVSDFIHAVRRRRRLAGTSCTHRWRGSMGMP